MVSLHQCLIDETLLLNTCFFVAVFTKSLCHIMEVMSGPLMQTLEHRLERNQQDINELQKAKLALQEQLNSLPPTSPHRQTSV